MARIAIGGFQHETNCFVPEPTDFAYFAAHRDRPPLCRGDDVVEWLTGVSFAMSGFLDEMASAHELVPLLWDKRRCRRHGYPRRLRAYCR